MTDATTDTIDHLLTLDPSVPEQAVQLRIGIAQLAGWVEIEPDMLDSEFMGFEPGCSPDSRQVRIPHYESSLDAALTLPVPDSDGYLDLTRGFEWGCEIAHMAFAYAATPALAVCRAWLKYKQVELTQRK